MKLRLGTRGSRLALTQASIVKDAINSQFPEIEIERVVYSTSGDKFIDKNLTEIGGKELFVKEIDEALLNNEIDLAIHSLKDVPAKLNDGITLNAVLPREDAADTLIGAISINELPKNAVVGTSSPRRKAQLQSIRSDLKITDIRGNIPTRIAKQERGEYNAIILAQAGLNRINLSHKGNTINTTLITPAIGQGAIAITAKNNAHTNITDKINDAKTMLCIQAERAVALGFGGDCFTPLAAYAVLKDNNVSMDVFLEHNNKQIRKNITSNKNNIIDKAYKIGLELKE